MNHKIFCMTLASFAALSLAACSDEEPVLSTRDWEGTDTYFASSDAQKQDLYYKPFVGHVGDPMPFYDEISKEFKILYLQDFRPNQAYTYHPIWAVSTKDGSSYTSLGELISCGTAQEQDAAIGTGSTIFHDGTYYTFYTGHAANQNVTGHTEAVLLATSTDFKNWDKNLQVVVNGGDEYSANDFRDPFVFKGDDGQFHMLVSTLKNGKGVIAEYTSTDLLAWQSAGVFMPMMWDRFYECVDLFKMGDWWYLVYSEKHASVRRVQYFKGRTLDELKACTANDAGIWPDSHEGFLDSRGFYAGKTASDGTNRYIWGWCPTRPGNNNTDAGAAPGEPEWGGNLVMHRLIQHSDGTLTLGEVKGIADSFGNTATTEAFTLEAGNYKLLPRLNNQVTRISMTITTSQPGDRFGFSFVRGSDSKKYYSVIVNPENETTRKVNFEEEGDLGIGFINGTDGYPFPTPADGIYHVTITIDNSVLTMYINDNVAYTNRIYGIYRNCWSVNSYNGSILVSDMTVSTR